MPGPLHGLRVIELAGLGPAPHACLMLADLGADVVRISRPRSRPTVGDDLLSRGRTATIEVDLKDPEAIAALLTTIDRADVLVEGFRPGVTERLGLGPGECLRRNPALVYARMTGWGQDGPLAPRAGHDINYLSATGVLDAIGRPGTRPVPPINLVGDFGGGSMFLITGILAALWERGRSGLGQVVDAAIVDGVSVLAEAIHELRAMGAWTGGRGENLLDGGAPFYDTYECSDGRYVAVGAIEPQFWAQLLAGLDLDAVGLPDRDDPAQWPALRTVLAQRFAARTRDEWAEQFAGTDACVTAVVSWAEAPDQEQLAARHTLRPDGSGTTAASAPRFSRSVGPATPDAAPTGGRPSADQPSGEPAALAGVVQRWTRGAGERTDARP